MKHFLRDALQILIALLLTTSVASAMKPPATPHITQNHVLTAKRVKSVPAAPKPATVAPVAPVAPSPAPSQPAPPPPPPPCETHECWMSEAGIAASDYAAVDYIVSHESGWNPNATEPYSGAHGLPQALPYSKTGCGWVDPVCQLRWANGYAVERYGGWWAAQAYWSLHRNW